MKFRNIYTGVVLTPKAEEVIEQLKKDNRYALVIEEKKETTEVKTKNEDSNKQLKKKSKPIDLD